ncbi:LapA family protein [Roseibium aestuarii]|uniref:LapA family protein n=1 Tax=Roseibium aestuarii TaxID=2600299 RepID=A0ABW4JZE2_9HYPH|nr:LapA family protein [Roseibium aestuarii]
MIRFVKNALLVAVAIVIVPLSVSNRHPVTVSLNPFDPTDPRFAITDIPLFWVIFASLALGIVLGGVGAWARQGKWRKEARAKRREVRKWQGEAEHLREIVEPAAAKPGLPAPKSRSAA